MGVEKIKVMGKTISMDGFEADLISVRRLLKLDMNNVLAEAETLPHTLHSLGRLKSRAQKNVKDMEINYTVWRAQKQKSLRTFYKNEGVKFTEAMMQETVRNDEVYKVHKKAIASAEENYDILNGLYWALQTKINLIIEINNQNSYSNYLQNKKEN